MRKAAVKPREIKEDPVFSHKLVTKLINRSLRDGKRSVAERAVYAAFAIVQKETGEEPLRVFLQAIENIKPNMEVRPRRIGGAAYQVPMSVRGPRRESLAIRWLVLNANARSNAQYKSYPAKLAAEMIDAGRGEGGAIAKKRDMERQAEANRAFSHFRW